MLRSDIIIKKIPFYHSSTLNKLFNAALQTDFAYFNPNYLNEVVYANRLSKLRLATVHPSRLIIGVYKSNKLLGYSISSIRAQNRAYLFWLYLDPNLRGQGLGKNLLSTTEAMLKRKNINTIDLVTHNQTQFYERFGFEMNKILPEYIAGVDMYAMRKILL
jgi:ribosomal protein S18 acetylase RimI-like enzyme